MNSLTRRVLGDLRSIHGDAHITEHSPHPAGEDVVNDDMDRLMDELSDADLRELLAELETQTDPKAGGAHS